MNEQQKPNDQEARHARMHYATMIALVIANICNLGLASLFASVYGQSLGLASYQIENNSIHLPQVHAATLNQLHRDIPRPIDAELVSVPSAPSNLSGSVYGVGLGYAISLSWNDNSDDENGFTLERATSTASTTDVFIPIANPGQNTTSTTDFNGRPSTTYKYRIFASNSSGNSAYSNIATIITPGADTTQPSVPQNLHTTQVTCSSLAFAWNASTDNNVVLGYRIYQDGIFWATSPVPSITLTSAFTNMNSHFYQVLAFDASSNYSYLSAALSINRPLSCPPLAPGIPGIAWITGNTARVTWQDNANNEVAFEIFRQDKPSGSFVQVGKTNANISTFNDTVQTSHYRYCYQIVGVNSYGSSLSQITCSTSPLK